MRLHNTMDSNEFDWTYRPMVAAFFAAYSDDTKLQMRNPYGSGQLTVLANTTAVWANSRIGSLQAQDGCVSL